LIRWILQKDQDILNKLEKERILFWRQRIAYNQHYPSDGRTGTASNGILYENDKRSKP
jgi:hypothetical protein